MAPLCATPVRGPSHSRTIRLAATAALPAIADRMVVKAGRGPFAVFFAGDTALRAGLARIAASYAR